MSGWPASPPTDGPPARVLTCAEIAAADAAAVAAGLPIDLLMRRAGEAVAARVAELAPPGSPVAVLCGPGNNGGDGYVAAQALSRAGRRVAVFAAQAPREGAAARAAGAWGSAPLPLASFDPAGFGLVVDALYGAGLTRPSRATRPGRSRG